MKNILFVLICFASIIILNLFVFILPIIPIQISFLVLGGIALLLYYKTTIPFSINILLVFVCILLNIFLIITFDSSYFSSDYEGWSVIPILLGFISAIAFSTAFCIIYEKKLIELFIGFILSGTLFFFYQKYLGEYGLIISEPSSTEMKISKRKKLFVSELQFSDSIIIRKTDTFYIKNGWIEKEISIDHRKLISKIFETGKCKIIIKTDGKYHNYKLLKDIYYKIENEFSNIRPLEKTIKSENFAETFYKTDTIPLYFYEDNSKLKLIKKIKAFPKSTIK